MQRVSLCAVNDADRERTWMQYGYCANLTDPFFAHVCNRKCKRTRGKSCNNEPEVQYARSICAQCPVLEHCRRWAVLNTSLQDGIAGGMTLQQRRALRVRLQRTEWANRIGGMDDGDG